MSNKFDTCYELLEAIEEGIDYKKLQKTTEGEDAVAALAEVIFEGSAESLHD